LRACRRPVDYLTVRQHRLLGFAAYQDDELGSLPGLFHEHISLDPEYPIRGILALLSLDVKLPESPLTLVTPLQ